jgi:hypothetical protein
MSGLYQSGFRPAGTPKSWEATSMSCTGEAQAGDIMRRYSVPTTYGDPVEAVGFIELEEAELKQLVADYENGNRAVLRFNKRGYRLELTRTPV